MNTCSTARSSCTAKLSSLSLLDGLPVRLRRPPVREATAGYGLRLATVFMKNPGERVQTTLLQREVQLQPRGLSGHPRLADPIACSVDSNNVNNSQALRRQTEKRKR